MKNRYIIGVIALVFFSIGFFYTYGATSDLSTDPRITKLQKVLKKQGYYTGGLDGKYGTGVYDAIGFFQEANNLAVTRQLNIETVKALNNGLKSKKPIITILSGLKTLMPGDKTELKWSATDATKCTLQGETVALTGTQEISPTATTKYTIICMGSGGISKKSRTIEVHDHASHSHGSHYGSTTTYTPMPALSTADDNVADRAGNEVRWETIAVEGQSYTLSGIQVVRMGTGTTWYKKQDTGTTLCLFNWDVRTGFAYPDKDPAPGQKKVCQVRVHDKITGPEPMPMGGPDIDVAKIPPGFRGVDTVDVKYTGEMPPYSTDETGSFRTVCDYSHMAFDDPIVKPGQPGAAHLHTFFGNTQTDAFSTYESLLAKGKATCRGGIVNKSAYWVPAIIDTRTGTPISPINSNFYYKTGYNGIAAKDVQPFPEGLRMLAGDPNNARPANKYEDLYFSYHCTNGGSEIGKVSYIPNCPKNATLTMSIRFPQCWDGVNLDSVDHKSHMSYTVNRACPATHPIPLPEVAFNIAYLVKETDAPKYWRLSSDVYDKSLPSGYSAHGDWFFGWDKAIMETWVTNCDQPGKDCHSHLLGDGRAIY